MILSERKQEGIDGKRAGSILSLDLLNKGLASGMKANH
jgi:hypothetical protein